MTSQPTQSIGEFSRSTLLSARQLRDYHEAGLLEPDAVDPFSGYRTYRISQIEDAILIRRLRELAVPLARIKVVMAQPDRDARVQLVAQELDSVGRDLSRRQVVLETVRDLTGVGVEPRVVVRDLAPSRGLVISGECGYDDIEAWCGDAFAAIYRHLGEVGQLPAGPGSASYAEAFYAEDAGAVSAWVPVASELPDSGDLSCVEIPGGRYAVHVHRGDLADYDLSYGLLGRWVSTHAAFRADAPVREHYLIGPTDSPHPQDWRTEICWPITTEGTTS